jgi:IPT/TIG domain
VPDPQLPKVGVALQDPRNPVYDPLLTGAILRSPATVVLPYRWDLKDMARPTLLSCGLSIIVVFVAGCGGGSATSGSSGPTTNGGSGATQDTVPVLTAIAPSSAPAGIPGITMSLYGSSFLNGALVQWNGSALPTTWVSGTQLSVNLPAADFAKTGTALVSVANPPPGGGTSSSENFTIAALPPPTTLVRSVNIVPQDIAWDSVHGELLASISSTAAVSPNSIVTIDPVSGNVGTPVAAGNNPHLLSISSDSSYLWVGLDGDNAVQRFLLPSLTKDVSFPLPLSGLGSTQQAVSLEAARVSPHTVGVVAGSWSESPPGNGVYIYDDATQRPTSVPQFGSSGLEIDSIQWGNDDSTIYGTRDDTTDGGGIATLQVTPSGVSLNGPYGGSLNATLSQYDKLSGLLYSYGGAYNPESNTQVGQFDLPQTGDEACTVDASLGRYYCIVNDSQVTEPQFELWVFDQKTYALINRTTLATVSGSPERLVRWGNAGLALSMLSDTGGYDGPGGLFLIDGAAVNPSTAPDLTTGTAAPSYVWLASLSPQAATAGSADVTVTITGRNFSQDSVANWNSSSLPTTYVSPTQLTVTIPAEMLQTAGSFTINVFDQNAERPAMNSLVFTVYPVSGTSPQMTALNLSGLDFAWDAESDLLYVGTADYDAAYSNSIVAIDPGTGLVANTVTVSPDPLLLSIGAGGQYLYVGFAGATNMTQFELPGLTSPLTWTLSNPSATEPVSSGPFFAGDLKAAPVSAHTTAVTLDYDSQPVGGAAVYDDATQRPTVAGFLGSSSNVISPPQINVVAWGSTDSILGGAQNDNDSGLQPFYTMDVNTSGATLLGSYPSFNAPYDEIHSDFGTGLIYSDDGNVANPVTGAIVGTYGASGLVAPDSTLNRVFILGQTAAQAQSNSYTIESFDEKAFTPVSSITINSLAGLPTALIRWGASGLALLTFNESSPGVANAPGGMLYIFEDTTFVSSAPPSSSAQSQVGGLVQQRWKRLSKAQIRNLLHHRISGKTE